MPAGLCQAVEVADRRLGPVLILVLEEVLKQHALLLKIDVLLMIGEEVLPGLRIFLKLSGSDMRVLLGASSSLAPEFGLDEKPIIEVGFLLIDLKHLLNALLYASPLDGFILVIEVLVHLLGVLQDLLVDLIVSRLG